MAQTPEGAKKALITIKQRHGEDFYVHLGRRGGQASGGGLFKTNREYAREMGRLGGLKSKRLKRVDNV